MNSFDGRSCETLIQDHPIEPFAMNEVICRLLLHRLLNDAGKQGMTRFPLVVVVVVTVDDREMHTI